MDGVLTTSEWGALLSGAPPALRPLVLRLALRHGFQHADAGTAEGGCLRLRPHIPEDPHSSEHLE